MFCLLLSHQPDVQGDNEKTGFLPLSRPRPEIVPDEVEK
jgi:hypothetical protein